MRRLIVALILLASIVALVPASGTTAAPAGTYYVMPTVSVVPTLCSGVECDTFSARYDYVGDGDCVGCVPPNPIRGSFSLTLFGDRFVPPNPIRIKSGTGTLTVTWLDTTTTVATYSFKARDSKTYALTGQVTGGTNTQFTAGTAVSGLVGVPPNPIEPATTSGAVSFG